ncbi:MAG: MCE family protein [Planctomycetes bacterium]|nr:MCE family protein [Planctomycetota bacterium]MCC7173350.1 MCE family protein [Planctomycetota bacterium]
MSATTTNRWKLGLFVVASATFALATLFWLGARAYSRETIAAVTYFDESVQGLDPGAPVKFRGVKIGTVTSVGVAQDQRHIEVHSEFFRDEIERLGVSGLGEFGAGQGQFLLPDLRAQIASAGITGLKFLLIDVFDPDKFPAPPLPFATAWNYLPAAPSTLKSVEDALQDVLERLPQAGDEFMALLRQTNGVVQQISDEKIPAETREVLQRGRTLLENGNKLLTTAEKRLGELDLEGVQGSVRALLTDARTSLDTMRRILDAIDAKDGLFQTTVRRVDALSLTVEQALRDAQVGATTAALRDSAERISVASDRFATLSDDLELTLERLRDTLDSVRSLSDTLRKDPSSVIHGREAKPASKEDSK